MWSFKAKLTRKIKTTFFYACFKKKKEKKGNMKILSFKTQFKMMRVYVYVYTVASRYLELSGGIRKLFEISRVWDTE